MKEGYGGKAGNHQFADRVLDGIRTEDVLQRIEEREADDRDDN